MKKGIALLFSFIILLSLIYNGTLQVLILFAKQSAHSQMHRISSHFSERISIPLNKYKGLEGNEYWMNDQLYDVRQKEITQDSVILVLYHDQTEESLVYAIRDFFGAENRFIMHPNEKSLRVCLQFFAQDQVRPDMLRWHPAKPLGQSSSFQSYGDHMHADDLIPTPSPPPRA